MIHIDYPFQSENHFAVYDPKVHLEITSSQEGDSKALLLRKSELVWFGSRRERHCKLVDDSILIRPIGDKGVRLAIGLMDHADPPNDRMNLNDFSFSQMYDFGNLTGLIDLVWLGRAYQSITDDPSELAVSQDKSLVRERFAYYDARDFSPLEAKTGYRTSSRSTLLRSLRRNEDSGMIFREAVKEDSDGLAGLVNANRLQIQKKGEKWHKPNPELFNGHPGFTSFVISGPDNNIYAWQTVFREGDFASLNGLFSTYDNRFRHGDVLMYYVMRNLFESGTNLIFQGRDYPRLREHKEIIMPMRSYDGYSAEVHL